MKTSLKIMVNDHFSVRYDATVINTSPEENRDTLSLKVPKSDFGGLITIGLPCEIDIPGKENLNGQIQNIRRNDQDYVQVETQIIKNSPAKKSLKSIKE